MLKIGRADLASRARDSNLVAEHIEVASHTDTEAIETSSA
jgi:hypothetical protein